MLDDVRKAEAHAMFLPTADNVFKFVPPHRWYRFQRDRTTKFPVWRGGEIGKCIHALVFEDYSNAIYQMAAYQKHRNPELWLAPRPGRGTPGSQDPNAPAVKVEENTNPHIIQAGSLVYESGQSVGPGARQL